MLSKFSTIQTLLEALANSGATDDRTYAAVRISDIYHGYGVTDTEIEWLAFDETTERWYLTTDKSHHWDFESLSDCLGAILNFGDEYLSPTPVADKPLSPAAIESAAWLASELIRLNG